MKKFPDNFFDLAVVDPPYGIGVSKGTWGSSNLGVIKDYGKKNWDDQPPPPEYFEQLFRVSKHQIIWGANHFISRIPFDSPCWIVWDKLNSADFADCELAWTSFDTAVRKFTFRWNGMLQGNMKEKEIRIHPTQKPVALYDWIFDKYAESGMKVLDTHLGSGSSRIAANKAGLDFWAFELDQGYYDDQEARYHQFKSQLRLF